MNAPREEKYYSTKVPEDREWDYIVVGSGMGGMTTASLLASIGKRVLVIEQHYVPGGFTHTFKRKKWVWDVGVHAIGEVSDRDIIGRVLTGLTDDKLKWASLGGTYDEFWFPGAHYDFADRKEAFRSQMHQAFPAERVGIDAYIRSLDKTAEVMRRYYISRIFPPSVAAVSDNLVAPDAKALLTTTTEVELSKYITDDKLKTVLTAQWGYYGVPPGQSSFAIHAMVARHFWHGAYYPVGGAQNIAHHLLKRVADAGGWTVTSTSVSELVLTGGVATGVRLEDGTVVRAKRVVSAIGALNTVRSLLPESERNAPWARAISGLDSSPAHVCLYLGFEGDIRGAGAGPANKWFYDTWSRTELEWNVADPKSRAQVLYCSFPSLKDPEHQAGPRGLQTGECVTFVPYDVFAPWKDERWRKRGEEYNDLKKGIEDRLLNQLLEHMPELKKNLAYVELSTPISTEHFTRSVKGAIYGLAPVPRRYMTRELRPRTPVKNLFLSGSDVTAVGVIGAMAGGLFSAISAEPIALLPWLRRHAL